MSLRFPSLYMMLWFTAWFDYLRLKVRILFSLVSLGMSVGTEHVLNFCGDDEDSALDPSNVNSFTPCGIELFRLV